jgi:Domain of unknown function (DUF4386)
VSVATQEVTTTSSKQVPPAHLAGLLYLVVIACGLFGVGFVQGSLIVSGDAGATANNIIASESLYRLGFAAQLVMYACYIGVTVIFYDLFKPASRSVSLFALSFSLVGIATGAVNTLNAAAPWLVLGGADYLNAFTTAQLQGLVYVFLRLGSLGFSVCGVFFGIYMIAIGGLIAGSTFLPRILGALLVIGGLCYLTDSFVRFLSPPLAAQLSSYITLPGLASELVLALWLFLAGVNGAKWRAQTGATEG